MSTTVSGERPRTVLLVDDEALITDIVATRLRDAGLEVTVRRNGLEAMEVMSKSRPDLVITDVRMPFMGGMELIAMLASNASTHSIPVILLTAGGDGLDPAAAPNVRATVRKPFAADEIVTRSIGILSRDAVPSAAGDLRPADFGDD